MASEAMSAHQGRVALWAKKIELYEVEEAMVQDPNIISFQLVMVMGQGWYFAVGAYIPRSDLTTLEQVKEA